MTQQSQPQPAATNHFDAAKIIVETLKALDKPAQLLAMRFASETLGIEMPVAIERAKRAEHVAEQASAATSPPGAGGTIHSTDIQQFTAAKAPKSDQQFAAVAAYFYRFEAPDTQRKDVIDAKTLSEAARLARRRRPANPGMTLNNAKNAGYLDAAGRGAFKISAVGENLVAMTLPGGNENGDSGRRGPRKPRQRKKTPAPRKVGKRAK
jgi:hypothetical protein